MNSMFPETEAMMKIFAPLFFALAIFLSYGAPAPSHAQEALPDLPPPIQNLVDEGAQVRYLGRDHGMDAWITIKNGQEQYFYITPDQSAFVMGLLFNKSGEMITMDQVQRLRERGDALLDDLAAGDFIEGNRATRNEPAFEFKSPSEQLYADIEMSNWVGFGQAGAPVLYAFIDPQCPHCHALLENAREEYLAKGRVQIRAIPVGFRDDTKAQAALLIASPNPQGRFFRYLEGDESALPAKSEINLQGVQRNLSIMQAWEFDVTPMMVYRAKDGTVKLIRGQPKDMDALIADIGARS